MIAFVSVSPQTRLQFQAFKEVFALKGREGFFPDTSGEDVESVVKVCDTAHIIFIELGSQFSGHFVRAIDESKRVILYYNHPKNPIYVQFAISNVKNKEIAFASRESVLKEIGEIEELEKFKQIDLEYHPEESVSADLPWVRALISFIEGVK